ncbi:DUF1441 family protein [Vibrio aestuarianus]|uniref:DUF1441 family protein n=1 Tax=Vibrio aestuarianus TaxID=28171 RepID=A0ABD7YQ69_9VIBR|nr:DUF1441 family protein [Vibrio aestuarianus]WGK87248.1 DUF1441 family protein [Vibrio aestuarianus]CAH8235220.1 conserved hypothetical protein [Vibrio aestuarianus]HDZ9327782.1 hypothetical protein [Vibrio cholerae]
MNNEKRLWNLSELEVFGYHRSTIRKKLKNAGIEPTAHKGSTPLYDVVQVVPYLCQAPIKQSDAPDLMGFKTAAEMRAYVQGQREKLALMKDAAESVTREDFENEIAVCIAGVKGFKDKVITRIESSIPSATPQQLEDLERLLNFDLKAVADELGSV